MGIAAVDQEAIVERPECRSALLCGTHHRVAHAVRLRADVGEKLELVSCTSGLNQLFNQLRLNLSRKTATTWSKRVAVLGDQDGGVGVAEYGVVNDQAVAVTAADSLEAAVVRFALRVARFVCFGRWL